VRNIDRAGRPGSAPTTAPTGAPGTRTIPVPTPGERAAGADLPSPAGTAVLNLTGDQVLKIRLLLVAMRLGRALAADVRKQIYDLLTGGQRKNIGAAWFILSVRA